MHGKKMTDLKILCWYSFCNFEFGSHSSGVACLILKFSELNIDSLRAAKFSLDNGIIETTESLCDSSHLRNFDILFPCLVFLSEPDRGSRESYTLDGVWHLNPLSLDLGLCARCTVPPWEAGLDLGTGDWSTPRPSHQNNQNYNWDLAPAPWRTSARLGGPKPRPFWHSGRKLLAVTCYYAFGIDLR